jgi:hypothetical protein
VPSWSQVVLPIGEPLKVEEGTRLTVELEGITSGYVTSWNIEVT